MAVRRFFRRTFRTPSRTVVVDPFITLSAIPEDLEEL
jgi:hypothetical protein